MRLNIDIDDALLKAAMAAGPFNSKRDAIEAGLRLLVRRHHGLEVLKWEGRLHWDDRAEAAEQKEWQAENQPAIEAYNEFVEQQGCFSDGLRRF